MAGRTSAPRTPRDRSEAKAKPQSDGSGKQPSYPIGSVDRSLRLLALFKEHELLRVADAADALGVARSTAHRLLAMLQFHGLVRQDERTRAYVAGPALVDIGLAVVGRMDIRSHTRPHLERLVAETGETAHLIALSGSDAIFLDCVESPKQLRVTSRVGRSLPANCVSGGKVLLAALSPTQLRALFPDGLPAVTPNSIRSLAKLEKELAEVRKLGVAYNDEESEPGVEAVAAGILDGSGHPRAAVALSWPTARMGSKQVDAAVHTLRSICEAASQGLF